MTLRIREVPESVRDALAAEAVRRGQSVQVYLLDLVVREARLLGGAAFGRTRRARTWLDLDPADVVREGRDGGFTVDREQQP